MTATTSQAPPHADDVWQIVADVWESMLGLPAVRADRAFELHGALTASVQLSGDWDCLVTVTLPRSTAVDVTRVMLQLEDSDEVSEADVADAVGEVVNVVGGNVKALLAGRTSLGLPKVAFEWAPVHAQLLCRTGVEWPGHVARVGVWRLQSIADHELNEGDRR
ncbi:chemotaxis protein CheX [Angustibacter sp. McL0619]|uniref:chemotaxis protein CheX n=1 Tax=Angustibacter sp. McL0619 TaxID=3415676 RepID=UPI003CF92BB9